MKEGMNVAMRIGMGVRICKSGITVAYQRALRYCGLPTEMGRNTLALEIDVA